MDALFQYFKNVYYKWVNDFNVLLLYPLNVIILGLWLKTNGEAIYKSRPWTHQNDSINEDAWYSQFYKGMLPSK